MADGSRDADAQGPGRDALVAAYKQLLQEIIDRRPSGTKQRIAAALGKHKSFVSQIVNPAYSMPLPAKHLPTVMAICHFSPEEREAFLAAYARAHPQRRAPRTPRAKPNSPHTLHIAVPAFDDPELQREVEEAIRQTAARIIALASRR